MAFYDTYHKVLNYIELSMSGEDIVLEDLLKEIAILFKEFQGELATADEAGHKELVKLMTTLQKKLDEHGKVMSARLGMSEDVMQNIADRPENFTPSQLTWIRRAKDSINSAGKELAELSSKEKDDSQKPKDQGIKLHSSKKGKKKVKKSDWLRS